MGKVMYWPVLKCYTTWRVWEPPNGVPWLFTSFLMQMVIRNA